MLEKLEKIEESQKELIAMLEKLVAGESAPQEEVKRHLKIIKG